MSDVPKRLRLRDMDDVSVDQIDRAGEQVARQVHKQCLKKRVSDTLTDVRKVIRQLPDTYFKPIATSSSICLENTRSGIKTLVGKIQRVKSRRAKECQRSGRTNFLLIAALLCGLALIIGAFAYFFVSSLMACYHPEQGAAQTASAQKP